MFKSVKLVLSFALCFAIMVPTAFAQEQKSLVALGDSITFGYNLDTKNNHPSKEAFPELAVEGEKYRVRNLGVPGDTSSGLLALLKTEKYRQAVRQADVITLNIGSNDFLKGASPIITKLMTIPNYQPTLEDLSLVQNITINFVTNLQQIVYEIRTLTDAPIVLYSIYNPFYGKDAQAGALLYGANVAIGSFGADSSIKIADAFTAFIGKQNLLILPGDVHPNLEGQQLLADLAANAIQEVN
jgi:lysophospholipase L1-like esterase